jgi:hypothetical protein
VFARFGARVTVVEAMERLLPAEEPEAGRLLATVFTREGITVRTAAHAQQVSHEGKRFTVALAGGEMLTAQRLLVATGRRADLAAVGLGAYGVGDAAGTLASNRGCGPRCCSGWLTLTSGRVASGGLPRLWLMQFRNAGLQWSPYRARSSGRGFGDVTDAPMLEAGRGPPSFRCWTATAAGLWRPRRPLALPGHLRERYNLLRSWMPSHHLRRCC